MKDTNTCDKCGVILQSNELIWITSEDFTPKDGETIPSSAFDKYDAVCDDCYDDLLI